MGEERVVVVHAVCVCVCMCVWGGGNDHLTFDLWPSTPILPPPHSVLSGWRLILGVHQGPIKVCLTRCHLTWLCLVNMLQHVCEGRRDRECLCWTPRLGSQSPHSLSTPLLLFFSVDHTYFCLIFFPLSLSPSLSVFLCGSPHHSPLPFPPSLLLRLSLEMLIPGPGRLDETELSFSH